MSSCGTAASGRSSTEEPRFEENGQAYWTRSVQSAQFLVLGQFVLEIMYRRWDLPVPPVVN